ncbi:pyridoxamine 5'-phosphate oxidase family protein [Rubrivivax gelatinosus]|uniref:pyridoxamine 5'-phosphate oxidase family protein n=1 Tax=Rubrivivax gelatinosus TaxID=28068 RepID=UPI003A8048F5
MPVATAAGSRRPAPFPTERHDEDLPQTTEDGRRLAAKLEGQRVAMLTLEEAGELTSRPLTPLEFDEHGRFWFFTSRRTMQPLLGGAAREANLAFADAAKGVYASLPGQAELVDSPELKAALWTAAARPWFPDGEDDPDLMLLKFAPRRAEAWDGPHSAVLRLAAMAASVVAARPIGLGEHQRLQIHSRD